MAFKALTVNTPPAQAAHILAEDDAAIYGGLLGQDCVLPLGQKLKATVISNNKVRIADGVVSVGGHIGRVISGDYEDMTIANGVSEKKRNDIIAARFIAGASGGTDTYKLVVIQGTAGTTASDPVTVKGDLYSGDKQRDYPLWRVKIEGLSIVKVEQMYKVGVSDAELLERMTEMNRSLTEKITEINSSLIDQNNKMQERLGTLTYWDNAYTGENGGTVLKMNKALRKEHTYIMFLRTYNGSLDTYAPWAYILSMRQENWAKTTIGTPIDVVKTEIINDGKFTITFSKQSWTRMAVYEVL